MEETREKQIEYVMENYFYTDDTEYYNINLSYLNELTDIELNILYNSIK